VHLRGVCKLEVNQRKEGENLQVRKLEGVIHTRVREEASRHIHLLDNKDRRGNSVDFNEILKACKNRALEGSFCQEVKG